LISRYAANLAVSCHIDKRLSGPPQHWRCSSLGNQFLDSTSPGAAASLARAGAEQCFILGINFEPGGPLAILLAAFLIRYVHSCTFAENPVSIVDGTGVLLNGHSHQRCGRMQAMARDGTKLALFINGVLIEQRLWRIAKQRRAFPSNEGKPARVR
jgi:hypothetical protein